MLKATLLNYQNNYAERSNQLLEHQNPLIIFKVPTKLFSDLYPAKFYIPQQNCSWKFSLKIMSKNPDIPAISLSAPHNYFDSSTKPLFSI